MASEEEKRIAHAYNVGDILSKYEPKLLEEIIRTNKNSEFVQVMRIAKDHRQFYQNIPRKDFNREYKNGYCNAKALIDNNPKLLNQLIASKKLDKDYLKGLEAGKTEHELRQIRDKVKNAPKPAVPEDKPDFTRGFNDGYKLSVNHIEVINYAVDTQKRWSPYIKGLQAGQQQYAKEVEAGLTKKDVAAIDITNPKISDKTYSQIRNKAEGIKENSEMKQEFLQRSENQENQKDADKAENSSSPLPGWLKNDRFEKTDSEPDKTLDKDRDTEPDM